MNLKFVYNCKIITGKKERKLIEQLIHLLFQTHANMPRSEVRGLELGRDSGSVEGRQGQASAKKSIPLSTEMAHNPLVWYNHLFVSLSNPSQNGMMRWLWFKALV